MNHVEFEYVGDGTPSEDITPKPSPKMIPEWYRRTPAMFDPGEKAGTTVKLCRAFSDALQIGWVIPAPNDIHVEQDGEHSITTTTPESTHVYSISSFISHGNSTYRMPEFKIDNNWKITTPEGYSSLIMKPFNRIFPGIELNSMFVPTDSYDDAINFPGVLLDGEGTIEKGEPLATVIPIKRDDLIGFEYTKASDVPDLWDRAMELRGQLNSRKDIYRVVYHQQKPVPDIVSESEFDGELYTEPPKKGQKVSTIDTAGKEDHIIVVTRDENYDILPGPASPSEFAPPWLGSLSEKLGSSPTGPTNEEELFDEWITGACSLGLIDRVPANISVTQAEDYDDRDLHTRYDNHIASHTDPRKIGPEFPIDLNLSAIQSDCYIAAPEGYCDLLTPPLNHFQQYFKGFVGIVDHDVWIDITNIPGLWMTSDEEFTISKGEPLWQAIPIKRESILDTAVIRE